jgi:hypothetical protein
MRTLTTRSFTRGLCARWWSSGLGFGGSWEGRPGGRQLVGGRCTWRVVVGDEVCLLDLAASPSIAAPSSSSA